MRMFLTLFVLSVSLIGVGQTTIAQDSCAEGEWRVNGECQSADALTFQDDWNTIHPEGETMCAHGTPYEFWVRPGNDDLLVYWQGGGGCWDAESCQIGSRTYTSNATISARNVGIFDTDNEENPFRDYTMVRMPSCTGDTYMGTEFVEYSDEVAVYHHGFINASAALAFIEDAFPDPDSIFVTGCSAGSVGSAITAPYLIDHYPDTPLVQLGDSLGAIFSNPDDLATFWGAEASIAPWLGVDTENFTSAAYYIAMANYYPDYTFAQYNTQYDNVQQWYFGNREEVAAHINTSMETISNGAENFRFFKAGGDLHCILPAPQFYQVTVGETRLLDWVKALINEEDVADISCEDCEKMELERN